MLVIRWWESSWYSSGRANSSLYRSFVVPFGGAGFRNLDSGITSVTSVTEKHTAGCRPTRPLAVAGEERAEPPLHHQCSRDNRSDGGDHDHSQREPCDPCLPLLAHLRAARVIDQPLLCMRAGVQPRAGEEGTSPVIGGPSKDWGCGVGQGMTGRVFDRLGIKDGMGFAPGGDWGRWVEPKRRRDGDRPVR